MSRTPRFLTVASVLALSLVLEGGAVALARDKTPGPSQPASTWSNKSTLAPGSRSLWDRSQPAGGTGASGGYAKPALPGSPAATTPVAPGASSGGYAKPALVGAGAGAGAGAATGTAAVAAPAVTATPASPQTAPPGKAESPSTATPAAGPTSGGYTKPALPGSPAAAPTAPAATVPVAAAPVTAAAPPPPATAFDKAVTRQQSSESLARYRAEQQKFSAPPQGTTTGMSDYANNPLYKGNAGRYQSYDAAYDERDRWRTGHPWQPPPYAYRSAPSFGLWDALFWWMVLDKITEPSHAAAAYHNANDPGFQAWRREADRMAQDNAELKAKLAVMDQRVATMQGTPQKPGTLPADTPPSVAMSPTVVVAPRDRGTLQMGTGAKTGHYYPFCQGEGGMAGLRGAVQDLKIACAETNGSAENLDGLAAGKFDAILVQSDIFNDWLAQHPGVRLDALKATLYQEYVQMLANRKSGVEQFSDLDPAKHTVYLVGSGAQRSWDSFAARIPALRGFDTANRLRRVPNDPAVLETVAGNPGAVLIYISGLNSDLLREADKRFGDKLLMALVSDSRLDSVKDPAGHPVYAYAKIPGGVYPKLQQSRWFGLTSSVPTLSVGAVFVLSERWVTENGVRSLGKVEEALWRVIPEMEKRVGVGG